MVINQAHFIYALLSMLLVGYQTPSKIVHLQLFLQHATLWCNDATLPSP